MPSSILQLQEIFYFTNSFVLSLYNEASDCTVLLSLLDSALAAPIQHADKASDMQPTPTGQGAPGGFPTGFLSGIPSGMPSGFPGGPMMSGGFGSEGQNGGLFPTGAMPSGAAPFGFPSFGTGPAPSGAPQGEGDNNSFGGQGVQARSPQDFGGSDAAPLGAISSGARPTGAAPLGSPGDFDGFGEGG